MKKLNNLFKSVANMVLPNHTYLFEDWESASEKVHSHELPVVIHVLPHTITMQLNEMQTKARNTTNCLLAFFDLCPSVDASGEEVAEVVDRCKTNARAFLQQLLREDGMEVMGDVRMEVATARGMAALAGVVMEINVRTASESLCTEAKS